MLVASVVSGVTTTGKFLAAGLGIPSGETIEVTAVSTSPWLAGPPTAILLPMAANEKLFVTLRAGDILWGAAAKGTVSIVVFQEIP